MKLKELIKQLEVALKDAGDIDVVVGGQYAASTDNIHGVIPTNEKWFSGEDNKMVCLIDTDLMTG